jgi:hypothetical protein
VEGTRAEGSNFSEGCTTAMCVSVCVTVWGKLGGAGQRERAGWSSGQERAGLGGPGRQRRRTNGLKGTFGWAVGEGVDCCIQGIYQGECQCP